MNSQQLNNLQINKQQLLFREEIKPTDLEFIQAIIGSTGFFSTEEVNIALELAQERLEKGDSSGYYFLLAEWPEHLTFSRVIGYGCFGPIPGTLASYDLYWIAVHNDFRGQGLGKKVLVKIEDLIWQRGGKRIYIETSARPQYSPTRCFYQACGYHEEAVLQDFYAPMDSKVIYCKSI